MKLKICLLISFFTCFAMYAQKIDITGEWTMYEMTWTTPDGVNTTTQDQMKEQGMMTDHYMMPDGSFKLVSNMTGSGQMETVEGTWKLEGDKLTYSLLIGERMMDMTWDFTYDDGVYHLKRSAPDGSATVVNSFKPKESAD